ncbi:MAG TPA: hypothetical protein VN700_15030 [Vicinamibacterales bacterium]|nr:hypothetical protein [Vicinamibacterales bacterium]
MKVESNPAREVKDVQDVKARKDDQPRDAQPVASVEDKLELSFGVNAVRQAIEEATPTRHIRPEAVARALALLESGKLGGDVNRLADRMLDSLVEEAE